MRKLLIVLIVMGICFRGFSQEENTGINQFLKRIEIKKSFDNKTDKAKPAIASFMIPAAAKNYFTINGAIAYRITKLNTGAVAVKSKLDIFGAYNRNTELKKEQYNYKAGVALEQKLTLTNTAKPRLDKNGFAKDIVLLYVSLANEYIKDKVDSTGSFASLLYTSPYFSFGKKFMIGKPVVSATGRVEATLKIMPGLEYQNKFDVTDADMKGSLVRLFFSASYEWFLKWREKPGDESSDWINMFEVSGSYTYRNDFYNNTNKREGYLPLALFNIAFYPFHNNNISMGATYQHGSDPINGIDDEEFWQFVFKFKKDIKERKD